MVKGKEMIPYCQAVGSLMYLATCTRPDIAMAVSSCSRFLENFDENHWRTVKRIFRYLNGTMNFGIEYVRENKSAIIGFSDSDWGGDVDSGKSRSGNVLVVCGGAVSWSSRL